MSDIVKAFKIYLVLQVEYLTGSLAQVKVFGKVHNIPRCLKDISNVLNVHFPVYRQHAAYGDDGLKYKYSGVTVAAKPWTPALKQLKEIVEKHSGFKYNFVLVNR